MESNNYFIHVAHDKNVLYDSYIVNFIYDATESYYERGKDGFMYLNNIKFPLFMLNFFEVALVFPSYACYFMLHLFVFLQDSHS